MTSMSSVPSDPAPAATPPTTPAWVKAFAIVGAIVLVLILGIVVANLAGFGLEHGPGRHLGDDSPSSPSDTATTPTATTADGASETPALESSAPAVPSFAL